MDGKNGVPKPPVKIGDCQYCNTKRTLRLVRNITNSGVSQVFWECQICKRNANGGGQYISHDKIIKYGLPLLTIPVVQDYRTDICAVCGQPGTELHHFAPRFIFGDDCEQWPKVYLCREHHAHWHALVTPNMHEGRPDDGSV